MRIERASGRFVASRTIAPSLVFLVVAFAIVVLLVIAMGPPAAILVWRILFVVSLAILIVLFAWRSHRIEVDGATKRIHVTHRRIGGVDERTVGFDEVHRIRWLNVRVPWKRLHRVDLDLGAGSVMLIDEHYRALDRWSAADVEVIVRGIAELVDVPVEERAL